MKYCKQCGCTLPDDYESDICMCCYDDMFPEDEDEEDGE